MSKLLGTHERTFSTDFAVIRAMQEAAFEATILSNTYATSAPGIIVLCAGTKYADVHLRLERWDGVPPAAGESWEDCDELPWQELTSGDPLAALGWDGQDPRGLDVSGLGRARVQVLASGRHRYDYETPTVDGGDPEAWLLRFYPDPQSSDAMSGPRRRIAGVRPSPGTSSAWVVSCSHLKMGGWRLLLPVFEHVLSALGRAREPVTQGRLLEQMRQLTANRPGWQNLTGDTPVCGDGRSVDPSSSTGQTLSMLAYASGMTSIDSVQDALDSLVSIGVLMRSTGSDDDPVLLPNPAAPTTWDALPLTEQQRDWAKLQSLRSRYLPLEADLEHLLRWAPDGILQTSAAQIAERLAWVTEDVLGVIELLVRQGRIAVDQELDGLGGEAPLTVSRPG